MIQKMIFCYFVLALKEIFEAKFMRLYPKGYSGMFGGGFPDLKQEITDICFLFIIKDRMGCVSDRTQSNCMVPTGVSIYNS